MVPPVSGPSPVKGSLWPGAVQRPEVLLAWPLNWVPDCVMVTVPVSTQLTWRLPLETSASRLPTPAEAGGPVRGAGGVAAARGGGGDGRDQQNEPATHGASDVRRGVSVASRLP